MTCFTDSPYEKMMIQKPEGRQEAPAPPALPPDHPCFGCPYRPCVGICYRKLMKKGREKTRSS